MCSNLISRDPDIFSPSVLYAPMKRLENTERTGSSFWRCPPLRETVHESSDTPHKTHQICMERSELSSDSRCGYREICMAPRNLTGGCWFARRGRFAVNNQFNCQDVQNLIS